MTRNQLFTRLNKLCLEMDALYNINNGGCCFVAACLAEKLEEANIPFEIIHYGLCGTHYAIRVSDRYLNRSEYKKNEIWDIWEGKSYTSERLYNLYYNEEWNHMYNRKWNLIVSTRIKSIFRKYANSRT